MHPLFSQEGLHIDQVGCLDEYDKTILPTFLCDECRGRPNHHISLSPMKRLLKHVHECSCCIPYTLPIHVVKEEFDEAA